jgi:catechol 2,3-dioxygenase-like lactoylglutathione lyase family enzyme
MEDKLIYGIQQIGIGVDDVDKAFEWYATKLGSDILVFDDDNVATYMAPYMGGNPHKKRALLAMNLQGGSGYEIWQYLDRKPSRPETELHIGDLGINIAKVKTRDTFKSFERLKKQQVEILSEIKNLPDGTKCFYIKDPYNNILQINEYSSWYSNNKKDTGGICGCIVGVSDIDSSLKLYSGILEYTKIIYDKTDLFEDLIVLPNGRGKFRRVLLAHENNRTGGFSKLFGESQIELIQSLDFKHKHIYQDRYWGDIGFIHLCFDIRHMNALVKECELKGFPFKVLSDDSFKMGQANGYWGFIEDMDGTLIEFVETHKVPLIKKLNWNINLKKRNPNKPLPDWLIKAMSINRVKFSSNQAGS